MKLKARTAHRAQSVTNDYFEGYVGKQQPAGTLKIKKCVDKTFTLRAKLRGREAASQARATTGVLLTKLEMNNTFRGAMEDFQLAP